MQETLRLNAPALLAWMDSQLRRDDAAARQRVTDFFRFIDAEEAGERVRFSIKPGACHTSEMQPCTHPQEMPLQRRKHCGDT